MELLSALCDDEEVFYKSINGPRSKSWTSKLSLRNPNYFHQNVMNVIIDTQTVVNTSNKQLQATGLYPRAKLISQLWMARLAFRDNTAESIPRSKGATDLSVFG